MFAVTYYAFTPHGVRNYLITSIHYLITTIMELICTVIEQNQLEQRNITDSNGRTQVFKSLGVTLSHGRDTIYCEAVQDMADYIDANPLQKQVIYVVTLFIKSRTYKTADGTEKHTTDIRLTSINYL